MVVKKEKNIFFLIKSASLSKNENKLLLSYINNSSRRSTTFWANSGVSRVEMGVGSWIHDVVHVRFYSISFKSPFAMK